MRRKRRSKSAGGLSSESLTPLDSRPRRGLKALSMHIHILYQRKGEMNAGEKITVPSPAYNRCNHCKKGYNDVLRARLGTTQGSLRSLLLDKMLRKSKLWGN